jgi:hypothetical protein
LNTAEEQLVHDIYLQTGYSISLRVNANLPISYLMALVVNPNASGLLHGIGSQCQPSHCIDNIIFGYHWVVDTNLLISYSMSLVDNASLQIGSLITLVVDANLPISYAMSL